MKKMKKISILLATVTILSVFCASFASCKKKTTDQTESSSTRTSDVFEPETEINYKDYLPEVTYDGADINIYFMNERQEQFTVSDENPDYTAFSQAVIKRNAYVEEKYDVFLNFICESNPTGEAEKFISVCAQSDAYGYDIMIPDYYWGTEVQGAFVNLLECKQLNLDNPYWVSGWNDSAIVNNRLYTAVSYLTTDPIGKSMVVYYNTRIAYDYLGQDNLHETVMSGNWTLETMKEMMALNTLEINNPDSMSFEDSWGLGYNLWGGRALLWGCGLSLAEYDEDEVTFKVREQRNSTVFDAVYSLLNDYEYSYYKSNDNLDYFVAQDSDYELFKNERALFYIYSMEQSAKLGQDMKYYGVLPTPKLDTAQKDYITSMLGTVTMGIFKTSADVDRAATILEALSIVSYEDVIPVYYDDMLKFRYQTDPKSAEMLDFIRDRISVDFLFVNEKSFEHVTNVPFDLIAAEDGNYEGVMMGKVTSLETALEKFMEVYSE